MITVTRNAFPPSNSSHCEVISLYQQRIRSPRSNGSIHSEMALPPTKMCAQQSKNVPEVMELGPVMKLVAPPKRNTPSTTIIPSNTHIDHNELRFCPKLAPAVSIIFRPPQHKISSYTSKTWPLRVKLSCHQEISATIEVQWRNQCDLFPGWLARVDMLHHRNQSLKLSPRVSVSRVPKPQWTLSLRN